MHRTSPLRQVQTPSRTITQYSNRGFDVSSILTCPTPRPPSRPISPPYIQRGPTPPTVTTHIVDLSFLCDSLIRPGPQGSPGPQTIEVDLTSILSPRPHVSARPILPPPPPPSRMSFSPPPRPISRPPSMPLPRPLPRPLSRPLSRPLPLPRPTSPYRPPSAFYPPNPTPPILPRINYPPPYPPFQPTFDSLTLSLMMSGIFQPNNPYNFPMIGGFGSLYGAPYYNGFNPYSQPLPQNIPNVRYGSELNIYCC